MTFLLFVQTLYSPLWNFYVFWTLLLKYLTIKLNKFKSSILPLNNPDALKLSLSGLGFQWSHNSITYLGVKLYRSPQDTIRFNFQGLLEAYESECNRLKHSYQSWIAKVALVKMFFLPTFIYLARTIPYLIPKNLVDKLQSLLLRFIWDNKKAWVNRNLLYLNSKSGGLGVPNLYSYNIALILEQSVILWDLSSSHKWASLENLTLAPFTSREILTSTYFSFKPPTTHLLSLTHLFQVCDKTRLAYIT